MFFTARGKFHFLIRAFFALPVVLAAVVLFIAALAMDSTSADAALSGAGCFGASGSSWVICHQFVYNFVYRFGGYVAAAFKLAVGAFKAWAPFKVFVVEYYLGIVPANRLQTW